MPRLSPSSTRSTNENQVQHRLNLYALAAGAAGVSMIALATPSEAEVIYTPAHATLGCKGTYGIDLNQDGVTDFTLQNACKVQHVGLYTFFSDLVSVTPAHENKVVITSGFNFAAALPSGTKIGRNQRAQSNNALMARTYGYNNESQPYYYGPWLRASSRYLGLEFQINGETHYGWARLSVKWNHREHLLSIGLTGFAYETEPNTPILAGQTKDGQDTGSAEPSSGTADRLALNRLGALALGVTGVPLWRSAGK
ncbi:MAG: hypothetical protein WAM04_03110 [Candidatus Sulfotelmatobacter sp.]